MSFAPIRISTPRLYMKTLELHDLDSLLEYHSDSEVVKFIPWPLRDRDMVEEALAKYMKFSALEKEGDYLMLGLYRVEDDQLVGQMNAMFRSNKDQLAEFGYVLNPRFSRNGYASEAASALITELFKSGMFHRVIARMDARNERSAALCKRIGLRLEAHHLQDDWFKNEWTDTYIFSILKEEWMKK